MQHPNFLPELKSSIRNIPDYPKPGILFKDLTPVFSNPDLLGSIAHFLAAKYAHLGITKVVAIESRGFIIGGILAHLLQTGFIPVRKPGKLPAEVFSENYSLEYGTGSLEIHTDALDSHDRVLLHDDLLATGGTAQAAVRLIKRFGIEEIHSCFLVELDFLSGRKKLEPEIPVFSVVHF